MSWIADHCWEDQQVLKSAFYVAMSWTAEHCWEKPKRCPRLLVHSWCISGALLVHSWCTFHSWCTSGALLVHSWCTRCTSGALSVHSKCFPKGNCFASERKPWSSVQKRLDRLFANWQTRKGIAPLPKGSLDPPHRNVWIAFFVIYKPERELHRFRKEASILCTETFGSCQLANPKGNCLASERKSWSSAQKRLDRTL